MWPFTKDFNVVIEGFIDNQRDLEFKLARIEIPEGTGVLEDGEHKYRLHGRTQDFKDVQGINGEVGNSMVNMSSLSMCEGVVLPYRRGNPNILVGPRSVCTRDGRIYVRERINETYIEALSQIVETAGEFFGNKGFSKLYGKAIRS